MDICEAINCGYCSESLSKRNSGNVCLFTTTNRICRLYVACKNPSEALIILTTFISNVYSKMWFKIKAKPSVIYVEQHLHQSFVLSCYLSRYLKDFINTVIRRSGFFCSSWKYPDTVISRRQNLYKTNVPSKNSKSDGSQTMYCKPKNIRISNIPSFEFNATHYIDFITWKIATEPPLTKR